MEPGLTRGSWVDYENNPKMPEQGLPPGNLNPQFPQNWRWTAANPTNPDGSLQGNGIDPTLGNPYFNGWPLTSIWTNPSLLFSNAFTDLVCLPINGSPNGFPTFPFSVTMNGVTYTWHNTPQLVESARGNCESNAILKQALGRSKLLAERLFLG